MSILCKEIMEGAVKGEERLIREVVKTEKGDPEERAEWSIF